MEHNGNSKHDRDDRWGSDNGYSDADDNDVLHDGRLDDHWMPELGEPSEKDEIHWGARSKYNPFSVGAKESIHDFE